MTRLAVAVITMMMGMVACADETPERTKPKTAADGGAKVEAQKPVADAAATTPTAVAAEKKTEAGAEKAAAGAEKPAAGSEKAGGGEKAAGGGGAAPYKVSEDGKKVDEKTYAGYGTYTNVCVPCHGRDATGGMGGGSNLVESLKKLSAEEAKQIILDGKPGTLMAGFKSDPGVAKNVDGIYSYLKGRSDGKIWGKSLEKLQ